VCQRQGQGGGGWKQFLGSPEVCCVSVSRVAHGWLPIEAGYSCSSDVQHALTNIHAPHPPHCLASPPTPLSMQGLLARGKRPQIPPDDQLLGGPPPPNYIKLMQVRAGEGDRVGKAAGRECVQLGGAGIRIPRQQGPVLAGEARGCRCRQLGKMCPGRREEQVHTGRMALYGSKMFSH
jgi:hypothetical protein